MQRQSLEAMQQGSQGFFGILWGVPVYLYQLVKLSCGLQCESGGYRGGDMLELICSMQKKFVQCSCMSQVGHKVHALVNWIQALPHAGAVPMRPGGCTGRIVVI